MVFVGRGGCVEGDCLFLFQIFFFHFSLVKQNLECLVTRCNLITITNTKPGSAKINLLFHVTMTFAVSETRVVKRADPFPIDMVWLPIIGGLIAVAIFVVIYRALRKAHRNHKGDKRGEKSKQARLATFANQRQEEEGWAKPEMDGRDARTELEVPRSVAEVSTGPRDHAWEIGAETRPVELA